MRQHLAGLTSTPTQRLPEPPGSTYLGAASRSAAEEAANDERWQVLKDRLAVAAVLLLVLATVTVFVLYVVQQAPHFRQRRADRLCNACARRGASERQRPARSVRTPLPGAGWDAFPHPDFDRRRNGDLRGARPVSAPRHEAEALTMLDSAPCLRVFVLGPAFVEWQGQRLAIARRQARGLLYRLAAQAEPVPREELCFTFWPDEPEADAHRHLSHLLSQLRQSLPLPAVVRAKNELVDLDRQLIWSDSAVFWSVCNGEAETSSR